MRCGLALLLCAGMVMAQQVELNEGPVRALRIALNILRTPAARRRVIEMRSAFNRYADHLGAVAIVAVKP